MLTAQNKSQSLKKRGTRYNDVYDANIRIFYLGDADRDVLF